MWDGGGGRNARPVENAFGDPVVARGVAFGIFPRRNLRHVYNDFERRLPPEVAGAKVVSYGRFVAFQMAEVAISQHLFADILRLIAELRLRLIWRPCKAFDCHAFEANS
jgi:hypothetical protein